jgi:hypothetical protein
MRNGKPNNRELIMAHLEEHGSISPLEAIVLHGIVRLAPRIMELRDDGHPIETTFQVDPRGTTYTRYVLAL